MDRAEARLHDFRAPVTKYHEAFAGFSWDPSWGDYSHHLRNTVTLKLTYGKTMWGDLKREKLRKPRSPDPAGGVRGGRPWRGPQPQLPLSSQHHAKPR